MEIDRTDLASLLSSLASDLRNTGLMIRGLSDGRSSPEEQESADMDRMAASLERIATVLSVAKGLLCPSCGLLEISEQIGHEAPRKGHRKRRKKLSESP